MVVHRPNFERKRHRRPRATREFDRRLPSPRGFGLKVVGAAALVFLGVLYSDRIPAAVDETVQFSRNLERDHAPPAGAHYWNCDEARAAGVAPIYEGEPGYRSEMDGDDDGVACEPYPGMRY